MKTLRFFVGMGLITAALAVPAFGAEEAAGRAGRPEAGQRGEWTKVTKGVWTRRTAEGTTETYAVGAQGMKWALVSTQRELSKVMALYQKEPTAERWQQVETLLKTIRKAEAAARNEAVEDLGLEEKADEDTPVVDVCHYDAVHANAYSLIAGIAANAYADHCDTGGRSGDVYARAYAQVTSGGVQTQQTQTCAHSGREVSCSVAASVSGTGYCTSEAYSSVFIFIGGHNLFYETSASRCGCDRRVECPLPEVD